MSDLFGNNNISKKSSGTRRPLADRMRPTALHEFVGQKEILAPGKPLRKAIESDCVPSIILWGPPGSGKTSLAAVIAGSTSSVFVKLSAVTSGIKDVKTVIEKAAAELDFSGRRTILFVDEIHRFNKAQQDAFLPHIENGTVTLIGATTENPSFEVIAALLSRARVFVLEPLSEKDLMKLIDSAVKDIERGLGKLKIRLEADAAAFLCRFADGDARFCLNSLEDAVAAANMDSEGCLAVDIKTVKESAEKKSLRYDNNGEEHYNLISAMHKSVRGSDVQASLYWFYRMIESGEDPLYIGRRLVRMATEDIGTADPVALQVSLSGLEAYRILGAPEGVLALAEAVVYNATAPKSNAIYIAEKKLRAEIRSSGYRSVPVHLRNAPTEMMKDLGYGSKYEYDHDFPCSFSGQEYMPDGLEGKLFFRPGSSGYEKEISRRLAFWEDLKHKRNSDS